MKRWDLEYSRACDVVALRSLVAASRRSRHFQSLSRPSFACASPLLTPYYRSPDRLPIRVGATGSKRYRVISARTQIMVYQM